MIDFTPELEDDSEDLTDAEVASAIPVPLVDTMLEHLKRGCGNCGQPVSVTAHALRRQAPYFYDRKNISCASGHESVLIFRADWLVAG